MDKESMTTYGWIAVILMMMTLLIVLATPFGDYIGQMAKNLTNAVKDVEENIDRDAVEKDMEDMFLNNASTEISASKEKQPTKPGLYDANNKMLASWSELTNEYKLDLSKDYDNNNWYTEETALCYILNTYEEFRNAKKIVISDEVTYIGSCAMSSCYELTYISIPNTVKEIALNAMQACTKLESIYIPASVEKMYIHTFFGCKNLKTIKVDVNNKVYDSRENCNAIIETKTNKLIQACHNSFTPNSVEILGEFSFSGCYNKEYITIPENVKKINNQAFMHCKNLKSVYISENVEEMLEKVFWQCDDVKLYCETTEKPNGWNSLWNQNYDDSTLQVQWGVSKETYEETRR